MGLAEKRIQEDFEKNRIPETLKKYKESTKGALEKVSFQIDWASLGDSTDAYNNLWAVWEQPLHAVELICEDDLGRDSIKKTLKKIVLKNVKDASQVKTSVENGVFTTWFNLAKGAEGGPGTTEYQKVLEKAL